MPGKCTIKAACEARRSDNLSWIITKYLLTAAVVVLVSEIANHAWYTFWYVIPTLPMFLAFPALLPRLGFWTTLAACVLITVTCFGLFGMLVRRWGISLF